MKAILREFAPTAVFAVIVITLMGITLETLTKHIQDGGVQHEQVIGKLNLIQYRIGEVEGDFEEHTKDWSVHTQKYTHVDGDNKEEY